MKENIKNLFWCCTDLLLKSFHLFFSFWFRSKIFLQGSGMAPSLHAGWRERPRGDFSPSCPSTWGPRTPASHSASQSCLRYTKTSHIFPVIKLWKTHSFLVVLQLYIQPITDVDGTLDCFRFGVSSSANGLVIGATVMEGFYVVFDRAQRRLGFALSSCAGEDTMRLWSRANSITCQQSLYCWIWIS